MQQKKNGDMSEHETINFNLSYHVSISNKMLKWNNSALG